MDNRILARYYEFSKYLSKQMVALETPKNSNQLNPIN
jgi:hypothetical protein